MLRSLKHLSLAAVCLAALAGCASDYSPNTYAGNAVQLANKVESGAIVGFRQVAISSNGNVGTVTGGAAGGLLGSEYGNSALAAVGGSAVGALVGNALDHAAGDTTGWEYIVRKSNGDMLSVTQREKKPLELGQRVLVIIGPQARVVPDYSTPPEPQAPVVKAEAKPEAPKESNVKVEVVLSMPPGMTAQGAAVPAEMASVQTGSIQATSVPTAQGRTVVVHVPITPAAGSLVPVSTEGIAPAGGTVSSAPEVDPAESAPPAEAPAPVASIVPN
ncbi:MAG: outer membrane lipoprotein [Rhodospirillaceae bacterium]